MPESLEDFLERVASASPTPGGGSVSAICGAMSAALSRMVANLAAGKQGYEGVRSDLAVIEARGKTLQARFLFLADEDARAYDEVVAAMRMARGTDGQRAARKEAMQAAYRRATEVPLQTMRACLEALELATEAAEKGNRSAITDAGVAALVAQAAMRGAALNARVNLASIADQGWRATREEELETLLRRAGEVAHGVDDIVQSRL